MSDMETVTTTFAPLDRIGWKADAGKDRIDLMPPEFVTATARVLAFGAQKYGDRNWEKGLLWSRVFAAQQRHMWAWWSGQDADEETGMSHLWHAACCMAFLVAYEARQTGQDDRPAREGN